MKKINKTGQLKSSIPVHPIPYRLCNGYVVMGGTIKELASMIKVKATLTCPACGSEITEE